MKRYAPDDYIHVAPFVRQPEGDEEIVIGLPDRQIFIALPDRAVELLDLLAAGKTIREAEEQYEAKYGELPELLDLLEALEERGFVRPLHASAAADAGEQPPPSIPIRYHFGNFPQKLAQRLFGKVALCAHGVFILLGLVIALLYPSAIPSLRSAVPAQYLSGALLALMLLGLLTIFIHEMAHLVAARAVGVSSRLGIGRRLWIFVAETDMTGIWRIERRQRYLPLLAGPLVDMSCLSLIVLVHWAHGQGWLDLPLPVLFLFRALFFIYVFRLLWQCYFFVRTDFYYVLCNLLSCKNLMEDTERLLRHALRRSFGRNSVSDPLEGIPPREQRFIRVYSIVWVLGRVLAIGVLFTLQLPFLYHFLSRIYQTLMAPDSGRLMRLDAMLLASFSAFTLLLGLILWLRSLIRASGQPGRA